MERAELVKLIRKAENGDQKAVALVREEFNRLPALWGLYSTAKSARAALVKMVVGDHPLHVEALTREAEVLEQRLAGPNPTPLESILAERAVACWLFAHHADNLAARFIGRSGNMTEGDFYRRWQDAAHRRFLSAVKTLALVRKLALPVLQVNVAQQQVNVAGRVNAAGACGSPGREQRAGHRPGAQDTCRDAADDLPADVPSDTPS